MYDVCGLARTSLVHFNDEGFRFLAYSLLRKSSNKLSILQNSAVYMGCKLTYYRYTVFHRVSRSKEALQSKASHKL